MGGCIFRNDPEHPVEFNIVVDKAIPFSSAYLTVFIAILVVSLFVGPEGGLTTNEMQAAVQYGAQPVSLGPRILRAETAGLVAASAILYELEG